jgi:hypothetical protein
MLEHSAIDLLRNTGTRKAFEEALVQIHELSELWSLVKEVKVNIDDPLRTARYLQAHANSFLEKDVKILLVVAYWFVADNEKSIRLWRIIWGAVMFACVVLFAFKDRTAYPTFTAGFAAGFGFLAREYRDAAVDSIKRIRDSWSGAVTELEKQRETFQKEQ